VEAMAEFTGVDKFDHLEDAKEHAAYTGWGLLGVSGFVTFLVAAYGTGMPFSDSAIIAVSVGAATGIATRILIYWTWVLLAHSEWVEVEQQRHAAPAVQEPVVSRPQQEARRQAAPQPIPERVNLGTDEPRRREDTITLAGISINTYGVGTDEVAGLLERLREAVRLGQVHQDQVSQRSLDAAGISRHDNSSGPSSAEIVLDLLEKNGLVNAPVNNIYALNQRGKQAFPVRVINANGNRIQL